MPDIALPVTSLTAIFAGALLLLLTVQVVRLRRRGGVVLGDNDDRVLAKAIRGHSNAAEQLPIALIVMGLAEMQGAPGVLLWSGALILIAGRAMHATYFAIHGTHWRLRAYGMLLTFGAQALLVLALCVALLT
jgi:uncharacterized membrane protein YecN with MAPEG domain